MIKSISLFSLALFFDLRYIVDYKRRRSTKHVLNDAILKAIEHTKAKVVLASSTLEIIKISQLKVDVNKE